jgi:hypothetical protein
MLQLQYVLAIPMPDVTMFIDGILADVAMVF